MTQIRDSSSHSAARRSFDESMLVGWDEPVRRYFTHAIANGAALRASMTLHMKGRIKVALWLPFRARQECDGSSFTWRAQVTRHVPLLRVTDTFDAGRASTEGRLLNLLRVFHANDENTVRAGAARTATEGIFTPIGLLPSQTCVWRAVSSNHIVVERTLGPEDTALHLRIDDAGAVKSASVQRWGNAGQTSFGYIPFGGEILAERRFGDFILPARLRVGWWFGTPRFNPFFEAEITHATPLP